jgi:hypothetical protein
MKEGKTFTKCRITIDTKKPISNFVYLQNIPKCLASKADNIYFNGKNYNILEKDPLIAWHFTDVQTKIELVYEVEGKVTDECMADLKDFAYATGVSKDISDPRIFLPLLLIPIIGIIIIYIQKKSDKKGKDDKGDNEIEEELAQTLE